jgi:hypothetical protein
MHASTRKSFRAAACASAMGFVNFPASQVTLNHKLSFQFIANLNEEHTADVYIPEKLDN